MGMRLQRRLSRNMIKKNCPQSARKFVFLILTCCIIGFTVKLLTGEQMQSTHTLQECENVK
jgi:TRAP-type C4-dicarboxylate transport system permease small subunit